MYNIPGSVTSPAAGTTPAKAGEGDAVLSSQSAANAAGAGVGAARTVAEVMAQSQTGAVLDEL
ncbi:MAG: hypothetical protein OEV90_11910, partial [Gammaproteobacteria bacterium]|nr:hypothetical protein [Gammaproteobacteria bacterium]